ncbi:2Fe-2S iron-sulfur cluster-binding protein [Colwellia sp. E2M01]|uniref:2Fe-2S iron-sulfur cluster-binding protein n=1 Tax=Colwellia sp. E2M01 TaxID=2841561 RepID=UPI001C08FF2C|nr:2Fe-2S iron-sulfur cluster-binding protein [Colwellia sp. E2M01]MBU2871444.1 2Fe-2S iron-sulfur cluster binding domain-containing protein [Colwellia sp. E2M01]
MTSQNTNKKVSIQFTRFGKKIKGNTYESILDQGEQAGLILPYSCRGGSCGRCLAKLISGEVKQNTTDGLIESEKEAGYILLCCSEPLTDIEVSHE